MSILTFYKPILNLGKSTEIPNHFYNASFLFYTYKCIFCGKLTLELMQNIMIIIKINDTNFGAENKAFYS